MAKGLSCWRSPGRLTALLAIGAGGYLLLKEHSAHLAQWLPFLILILCPLMHLFMHRGHQQKSDKD